MIADMIKKCIFIATVIVLAMLSSLTMAQKHPTVGGPARDIAPVKKCLDEFKSMDNDNDGKVTKKEFMSAPHDGMDAAKLFDSLDKKGKGYLTMEEYCIDPQKDMNKSGY